MDDLTALHTQVARLEERIKAQNNENELHFRLNDKALEKALATNDAKLLTMNEMRSQLDKTEATYAKQDLVEALLKAVDERIKKLEVSGAFNSGKSWMIVSIIAAIPTVLALLALFKK